MEIKMSNSARLRVSVAERQGGRKYMEDATSVHVQTLDEVGEIACFSVFDGHGGRHASFYARVRGTLLVELIRFSRITCLNSSRRRKDFVRAILKMS